MAAPGQGLPAVTDGGEAEPSPEELLRDAEHAFGEIFSVRAPRDVLAGMWSGVQCVLSGVFLGMAGVIMQPIEGMRDAGVPGCFKGVAVGLCTGLFFSLTGLCTGMFQAVRGALATPRALCMVSKGRRWDGDACSWVEPQAYSLPAEAARVLGGEEDEEEEGPAPGPRRRVADSYYYDQLGVSPSASQREIRQAYFSLSRQWHPDKTQEPQAKERFQAISEAYQVLSDPARRRAYDAQGRQGAGEGFIDARAFFGVLLGADALQPHVGRLRLAEMFGEELLGETEAQGEQDREGHQLRRQVRLAVQLAARLDARPASTGFRAKAQREARDLLRDAALRRLVAEIGWLYLNRGRAHLAAGGLLGRFGLTALGLRLRGRGREARQRAQTAGLALRSFLKLRKIVSEADDGQEDEMPSSLSSALPTFMDTFWSLAAHDIAATLDRVLERVLTDASIGPAERRHRAEGLRELGAAFLEETEAAEAAEARAPGGELQRQRFEEAFAASVAGGQRPD